MAFTTTSKYVQLTPYLVMEYMYADQPNPETYNVNTGNPAVGFNKLINGILKYKDQPLNEVQIFNPNEDYSITQNTSVNSVVKVSENSYITLNPNLIVPYNDFNTELTNTADLPIVFPSNISVVYDSVRYHVLQGYNLANIDGLILGIQYLDQDGSYVTFSQILINSGTAQDYTLNPAPLTIGSNIYDKYFEIKIPSLLSMNNQYAAATSPNKPNTLAGKTSKSGQGYVYGSPIRVNVYEVLDTTQTNGYDTYGVNTIAVLSLESEDPFTNIGAFIAPADAGDFFQYFATDNGGFIENFILFQNSIGNQYYIEHTVETLEQIGAALITTNTFSVIQTTAYDVPNLYRPIVRYAGSAASFTLRYTMNLINSKDQSRLVRNASYTSSDPGRYGTNIQPLALSVLPQVQKIYNKVASAANITVPNNNPVPREIVKYANVFVERNLVNTTMTNLVVRGTTITQADSGTTDEVSYGIGQAYITLSPFDNYYKFTFYKRSVDGTSQLLDLTSSGTFSIVFIDNSNNQLFAPSISDKNLANAARGELAFKVDQSLAKQVLNFTNRRFYISNQPVIQAQGNFTGANAASKISNVKQKLASRAFGLKDTIKDLQLAARTEATAENNLATTRISASSSSVLYYGTWLKDGETRPSTGSAGTSGITPFNLGTRTNVAQNASTQNNITPSVSSWQAFGGTTNSTSGTRGLSNTAGISTGATTLNNLGIVAFKSAIASDVQGKIQQGWDTEQIISYFLNPQAAGYKIYSGITKQIFTDAVTGIFSQDDLLLLKAYGNTRGGRTTGGPASAKGTNVNQSGGDNGSSTPTL
jgi:hypothetical protein